MIRFSAIAFLLLLTALPAGPAVAHDQPIAVVADSSPALEDFTIYRPADMDSRGDAMPVVIWGNGGCSLNHSRWLPMIRRLAGEGYVVLATGQPLGQAGGPASGESARRYTDEDLERAVDWAVQINGAEGTVYSGRLDTTRIALAGNSCGGITAVALASRDERIKSIFILSGGSIGPYAERAEKEAVMRTVRAPLLYVVGGKEDFAHDPASVDYELIPQGVPMLIIARSSGDHGFVSVTPAVVTNASDMAASWFRGTLSGDKAALRSLTTSICPTCAPDVWTVQKHKNLGIDE